MNAISADTVQRMISNILDAAARHGPVDPVVDRLLSAVLLLLARLRVLEQRLEDLERP